MRRLTSKGVFCAAGTSHGKAEPFAVTVILPPFAPGLTTIFLTPPALALPSTYFQPLAGLRRSGDQFPAGSATSSRQPPAWFEENTNSEAPAVGSPKGAA